MKYQAILFGSIGTLIESSNIQRNSFNEAFKEAGLDWYWDEQDYKILLKKSGGTKRVEDFAEKNNTNVNASQIRNRKTEIFSSFIIKNKQKLRKSVDEILKYKESFGVDNLLVRVQWPGLGQGEVLKTLDHLGKIIATVS